MGQAVGMGIEPHSRTADDVTWAYCPMWPASMEIESESALLSCRIMV